MITNGWHGYEKTTGKTNHIYSNNFLTMFDPLRSMMCDVGLYRTLQWTNLFHTH